MILPPVSELLGRVARHAALEESFDALRRKGGEVRVSGLTDPAKSLAAALAFAELGRPIVMLVESNQRAEAMVEPLSNRDLGRACELPMTKVTAMVSPSARPSASMMPPITPTRV